MATQRPAGDAAGQTQTIRTIAGSVLGVPVILIVVVFVVQQGAGGAGELSWLPIGVSLALAALVGAGMPILGYRLPPLPRGTYGPDAQHQGLQRFQAGLFVRLALGEVPVLVALALTFVESPVNVVNTIPGAAASLLLMWMHVWPNRGSVLRCEQALDREGGRSRLAALFGY